MWPLFTTTAAYAMNTFASDALDGLSPYQLVFKKEPPDLTSLTFPPVTQIPTTHRDYYALMKERADMIAHQQLEWKNQQAIQYEAKNARYKQEEVLLEGQLVYLLAPTASTLQSGTTKFRQDFIGPLVVDTPLDKTHYKLRDLLNIVLPGEYHINRLKKAKAITPSGIVETHQAYLDAIRKGANNQQLTNAITFDDNAVTEADNSLYVHLDCSQSSLEEIIHSLQTTGTGDV